MMKHKWHDEIVAWAGGAEIEWKFISDSNDQWEYCSEPRWNPDYQYRIKPQPKAPKYLAAFVSASGSIYLAEMQEGTQLINGYLGKVEIKND